MHSNVLSGADDRASQFVRTLGRLKRTGCNLLLVGHVSDAVLAEASQKLLGDARWCRFRLFVLTDADRVEVADRLPAADRRVHARRARVLACGQTARSATNGNSAVTTLRGIDSGVELPRLSAAIDEEIEAIEAASDGLEPAQLRVCFDSLGPLLAEHGTDAVSSFLDEVTQTVLAASGMAHYVLPHERDHELVAELAPHFDAIIEYRVVDGGQERWRFPDTDFTTQWLPLR